MATTIQIDKELKKQLDSIKAHPRETYNELILRLLNNCSLDTSSRESLIATIEVMSDPEMMMGIRKGLQEEGGTPLEEFERELGI